MGEEMQRKNDCSEVLCEVVGIYNEVATQGKRRMRRRMRMRVT
jgi:hypothetical protein